MENLRVLLTRLDGKGYKGYKEIIGIYKFHNYLLNLVRVQGDPFASPSLFEITADMRELGYSSNLYESEIKLATEDYILRELSREFYKLNNNSSGSGKSGLMEIYRPSYEVIKRSAVEIMNTNISIRFYVGLPARGRKILANEAIKIIFEKIPKIIERVKNVNKTKLKEHIDIYIKAQEIRKYMKDNDIICFIANGSVLARRSAVDDRPMQNSVKFLSPKSLEEEIKLENGFTVKGMAIRKGVTIITGGGFHGKTTLLDAIEKGIYNHIPGDGREFVLTCEDAVKIKAENGRYINHTDISEFIKNLPDNKDTKNFFTENASGSTSQAANIVESIELGAKALLIDEDTSATNFMMRDDKIQELIPKDKEPIKPFIEKIQSFNKCDGISTILVIGGLGEYFKVADTVLMMDEYKVMDVTEKAKIISEKYNLELKESCKKFEVKNRHLNGKICKEIIKDKKFKIKNRGLDELLFGREVIDIRSIEQLIENGQVLYIGEIINKIFNKENIEHETIKNIIESINYRIEHENIMDILFRKSGKISVARKYEIAAAINRIRKKIII